MNFGLRRKERVDSALQTLPRAVRTELVAQMIRLCSDPQHLGVPATYTAAESFVYRFVGRDGRSHTIFFDIDHDAHAIFVWDFVPRGGYEGL